MYQYTDFNENGKTCLLISISFQTDKEFCFNSDVAIITNCGRAGISKSSFNVKVTSNQGGNDTTTVNIHMVDVLIPFLQSKLECKYRRCFTTVN